MIREGSLEDISDGKKYRANDMVRANCLECKGCSDCCHDMGNTIQLDPRDICDLNVGLEAAFEELIQKEYVELTVVDGLILPNLNMDIKTKSCKFLSENQRCTIHSFRPGICRLFPLGRVYEDRDFSYFLQTNQCSMKNRAKIKVSKWVDVPHFEKYETYVKTWHYLLKDIGQWLAENGRENTQQMASTVLKYFYMEPYSKEGFYEEFASREQKFRKAFQLH